MVIFLRLPFTQPMRVCGAWDCDCGWELRITMGEFGFAENRRHLEDGHMNRDKWDIRGC